MSTARVLPIEVQEFLLRDSFRTCTCITPGGRVISLRQLHSLDQTHDHTYFTLTNAMA